MVWWCSLTDIATAHSIIEILTDMLSALDPQDGAVMFRLSSFLLLLLWACLCFDSWDNNLQYRIILPSHLFFSHGFTILCLLVKIKPDMLSWGQWFYCELLSWSWAGSEFPTSLFEQFFHAGHKGGGYSGTCRSMPYKSALCHGTCEYDIVGSFLSLSFSLRLENVLLFWMLYCMSLSLFRRCSHLSWLDDSDEELLGKGLQLNDDLQRVLAKHDAISSGSPLPPEPAALGNLAHFNHEEDELEDDFTQLAHRYVLLVSSSVSRLRSSWTVWISHALSPLMMLWSLV